MLPDLGLRDSLRELPLCPCATLLISFPVHDTGYSSCKLRNDFFLTAKVSIRAHVGTITPAGLTGVGYTGSSGKSEF